MKILSESKEESSVFGLKIARANNIQTFNFKEIAEDVHSGQLDLFRVKISMTDPAVFDNINKLGIPYNFFSFLIRKSVTSIGVVEYKVPELKLVPYDSSMKQDLINVLDNVLRNSSGTNFSNRLYNFFIDKDKMTNASIEYYVTLAETDPNSRFFLGYINDKCAGFCSFRLENNISEGIYFGISTEFRNLKLAHEFLTHGKEQSFKAGVKEFWTDTIIQNPNSLYPQMNIGLIPKQTFVNAVFFPFLSLPPFAQGEFHAEDYLDILQKIKQWLSTLKLPAFFIDDIKTIHLYNELKFPALLSIKLFVIDGNLAVVSVSSKQYPFWTYMTGTLK
ncbi:MAG: hypothetical protein JWN78_1237 [Bacteroidota bacterium]|nr:hypothetical protein [Bacteroidota bacterium]